MSPIITTDIIVFGDELESCLTAISAARLGASVTLVRYSSGMLGGLSTRGGLSYMDITPGLIPPLMGEFFKRIGFIRVALYPLKASNLLQAMLDEAGVTVISGIKDPMVYLDEQGSIAGLTCLSEDGMPLEFKTQALIDTSPDADLARQLGIPYLKGLSGIFNPDLNRTEHQFLGISPVFQIAGIHYQDFRDFEARLRAKPEMRSWLDAALPNLTDSERDALIERPTYVADKLEKRDYLDILNPVIGIDFHHWCNGEVDSYPTAPVVIDGGNMALLTNDVMSFNGLVYRLPGEPEVVFEQLLDYSHGATMPAALKTALARFEDYLRDVGGFSRVEITPPQELYVRNTLTFLAKKNMTALDMIAGGVPDEQAVGVFSYWLDVRGIQLRQFFPDLELPKPVFNVGLDVALPLYPLIQNFAFVSRSGGYSPLGQGAGRIVQHNCLLGEAVGVAAALSVQSGSPIHEVAEQHIRQIQLILEKRAQALPLDNPELTTAEVIKAKAVWDSEQQKACELLQRDVASIQHLRESVSVSLSGTI